MHYTESDLLDFVKQRLGFPYNPIEINDDKILDIIFKRVIPIFSKYFPHREVVTLTDTSHLGGGLFKLPDDYGDGKKFLSVISIVDDNLNPKNLEGSTNAWDYTTRLLNTSMNKQILSYKITKEGGMNYIKIDGLLITRVKLNVEMTHALDLSTLTNVQIEPIEVIALGEVSEVLLQIRNMYQNVASNTGEINLNLDMLTRNIEAYQNMKEELRKAAIFSKRLPLLVM